MFPSAAALAEASFLVARAKKPNPGDTEKVIYLQRRRCRYENDLLLPLHRCKEHLVDRLGGDNAQQLQNDLRVRPVSATLVWGPTKIAFVSDSKLVWTTEASTKIASAEMREERKRYADGGTHKK